jgi:hypothetical protein
MPAFANGIVTRDGAWPEQERRAVSEFMVETVNANIREFLRQREHLVVQVESAVDDFRRFWDWIDATGDKHAALREWGLRYHARKSSSP